MGEVLVDAGLCQRDRLIVGFFGNPTLVFRWIGIWWLCLWLRLHHLAEAALGTHPQAAWLPYQPAGHALPGTRRLTTVPRRCHHR